MDTASSMMVLGGLVVLATAPWFIARARRLDAEPQPASPAPGDPTTVEGVLSAEEALAHHMYGQAVGWDPTAMADYDASPAVQALWRQEARYKLEDRLRPRIR